VVQGLQANVRPASPGSTFLDSEMPALFGESLDAMLFTCVGVPECRSAAGGPADVRMMQPRL